MRLINFITCQVLPDDIFESDLHYNDGESYFSALCKVDKKLQFSQAIGQNTIANMLSDNG